MDDRLPRIFKTLVVHAVPLENGKSAYEFLGDSNANDPSVIELEEKEIVRWLINNEISREFILKEIIENIEQNHFYDIEIKEPVLTKDDQKKIGDIDFLICPINRPDLATVIEFKRIKVITKESGEVKINRFEYNREKGVKQIRELRNLEFYKTYLGIIIEDDGRYTNEVGTIFKSSKGENIDDIFRITFDPNLDKYSGVIFIIVNQPTGEIFTSRYNLKIVTHRNATPMKQNEERTNRIRQLMKEKIQIL